MSAKKNIDWDAVDGIDDAKVSLRVIAKRVGCSHAAVEQARGKRSRLEEENANLRRVLGNVVEVLAVVKCFNGLDGAGVVMLEEAEEVLRG